VNCSSKRKYCRFRIEGVGLDSKYCLITVTIRFDHYVQRVLVTGDIAVPVFPSADRIRS
jgi:hypothetical protein